eukprot:TRINITY_DN1680_c0_g1_i4.p1 TRINITY_DN1680_c0_g1~~TRINITY_DN1680_c0_g1_i4.p1  ORF type:complete len:720 (-),score=201.48 TRINITY_DN1680_c0_g1_i4:270-2429(-)
MKFSNRFQSGIVDDWRENYVSYLKLKRILKRLALDFRKLTGGVGTPTRASPAARLSRTRSDLLVNNTPGADERKRLLPAGVVVDPKTEFFSTLDDDLNKVSVFFTSHWDSLASEWGKLEAMGALSGSLRLSRGGPTASSGASSVTATGDARPPQAILKDIYIKLIQLKTYCQLNAAAVKKIVKKYDRLALESSWPNYHARLSKEAWTHEADLDDFLERVQNAHTYVNNELYELDNDPDVIKAGLGVGPQGVKLILKPKWAALALVVAIVLFFVPILTDNPPAHRCVSLLVFITVLWVTEAVPFFVSSLAIPFLVVVMRVLVYAEPGGGVMSADDAKTLILSKMFDHTVALIIGGFSISAAFSKHHYELQIASIIQQRCGHRPWLFLLLIMLLAWFLSMWISNVAAPVLVTAVLQPIMHDLPANGPYVKALVLAVAFSSNIGGMLTPIASPQNAIALGDLPPTEQVSFLSWMLVAVPFGLVAVLMLWLYLLLVLRPNDVKYIPEIEFEQQHYTWSHYMVLAVTLLTIGLWCTLSLTDSVFGDMGIVAFIPLVIFLSTGILSRHDFTNFSWPLIFLIAGGNCLGAAISSCGLLTIIGDQIQPALQGLNLWVTLLAIVAFLSVVTTFVSHTVSAIILIPVVIDIGKTLGNTRQLVVAATLMCSASMSLPMTSFPNVNALMLENELQQPYVKVVDFIRYGGPFTLLLMVLLLSFGYMLLILIL